MNTQGLRHPRFARTIALTSILVLALTGSQQVVTQSLHPVTRWEPVLSTGTVVGTATFSPMKIAELAAQDESDVVPVVNVPSGLSLKQVRKRWEKMGSPLPDEIVRDAPYEGAPRESIVDFARNFEGAPYAFTGSTPYGFDCSGYVRFIYSHFGLLLPHSAREQADFGTRIKAKHAKPGDLVIWSNGTHSAIYAGSGKIIHATKPGSTVVEVDLYTDNVFYVRLPVGTSK